jgi:large subunit ribosomal protein L13
VWKFSISLHSFFRKRNKMDSISYKTISLSQNQIEKNWLIIDAEEAILGRLSSGIAKVLKGKHKPSYTPNMDCGDNVIVINAEKVKLTGKKMTDKEYVRYTGHPGGQRFATPREVLNKNPKKVIEMAVKGMLPKNRLGRQIYTNLYVYEGAVHPHVAQNPKSITL